MSVYNYSSYKILIDPNSKKTQGLKIGDVVKRQYFDSPNLIYSLMVVLETGVDIIGEVESYYFIGALLEGDEPESGQILDFARVTSLCDSDRSGALYLTASDSQAPYLDVIDGLAFDNSLCFPSMSGGKRGVADKNKYCCIGENYLITSYLESENDVSRIYRLVKNEIDSGKEFLGLQQAIENCPEHPNRLLISFRMKGSKVQKEIPVSFGYSNGNEMDGKTTIDINDIWEYKFLAITVDYPSQYQRSFLIDLTNYLIAENDFCEIADLNIVCQSDISVFSNGTKARVGKVKGIVDPVFGVLDGYGAYFQNLYATNNVNIAGTLTAGDENGFSSTFYVGKIHKNVVLNSIQPAIEGDYSIYDEEISPVGIGSVYQSSNDIKIRVQTERWRITHEDQKYCFSLWIKSDTDNYLSFFQDEYSIQDVFVEKGNWRRIYLSFVIHPSKQEWLYIRIKKIFAEGVYICAPQFESGVHPSQYQPTDGTLSYVEDYGAWFSKGGIGGTIQNPLLQLNEDGSIRSKDGSFVINSDGTGYFSSGRFKWTKDTIILQDVTIRWEDFDEDAQEMIQRKSVSLSGSDLFHYADELDMNVCDPTEIYVFATEQNFVSSNRKWQYLCSDSFWKDIDGNRKDFICIYPDDHFWEDRKVLSVRYVAYYKDEEYSDIFTLYKHFDGQSAYSLYIDSTHGTVFRNNVISTTLSAHLYRGGEEVTDLIPEHNFKWIRISENAESDEIWNSVERLGKTLEVNGTDVFFKAVFDCKVTISTK